MTSTAKAMISIEAQAVLAELLAAGIVIPGRNNCAQYRTDLRNNAATDIGKAVARFDGDIEDLKINGIPCKQLTPARWSRDRGLCIQYAFGGGYVSGSTDEDLVITAPLAQYLNARIVMVDYRLSPEHPFPEPQQDMQHVYAPLIAEYGADRLVVSGESAGGNQALGLLQVIRQSGLEQPRCAVLFSPWVDLTNQGDSHGFNDNRDPTLSNAWIDSASEMHANGHRLDDPGISPLFGDMHGLAPCIITTGSRDLLLSQCLRLAQKLRDANVECDLRVWEGMWHVFEFYPIPEAQTSIRQVGEFIKTHC